MNTLSYQFASTMRIVSITLAVIGLLIVLVEGYINNEYTPTRFILMGILAWNIVYFFLNKPRLAPAPPTNEPAPNENSDKVS